MSNILKSWFLTVFHPIFICDLFICDSSSVISSTVPLSFIYGSVHYTENIGIRTWKMPYGINNNIFHKLQEKNTLAFSNWTLQIKSLMKSAHAKHFQKLVRCNSYLGPLITSPPQITVFTLYVIHALSTGTYITSFTLTTGHFTKYKSSPDMYNGIIFISIKCGFFCFF